MLYMIKGLFFGKHISIINIYYPPNHPTELITKAFTEFADMESEQSTSLLDPQMDKSPSESQSYVRRWDTMTFVGSHTQERSFFLFFSSSVHASSSRIDYLIFTKANLKSISSCSV